MAIRIVKALSSVAEFISRFWPISKDEETLLAELMAQQRTNVPIKDPPADAAG